LVMEFEKPAERNNKWLNALDPEQNYGLLAARPGKDGPPIVLDGRASDWTAIAPLASDGGPSAILRSLSATSDEAYLYLLLRTDGLDWESKRIFVGIDTYGDKEGDTRFPGDLDLRAPTGMEFMLDLSGEATSRILVDTPYDLFTHRHDRPYRSVPNDGGRY